MSEGGPRILHFNVGLDLYDLDGEPIPKVIEWAKEIVDQVPEEYRSNCFIEWEPGGYDTSGRLSASYNRPETDLERQKRERDESEAQARAQTKVYEHERALYERLKAKFEGTGP